MNIQGLDNFIRTLNNASNSFDEEASKRLNNISQKLIKKVKLKTPVDSGLLRRSWRSKKDGDLARIVYNNVHYARRRRHSSMVRFLHRPWYRRYTAIRQGGTGCIPAVSGCVRSVRAFQYRPGCWSLPG